MRRSAPRERDDNGWFGPGSSACHVSHARHVRCSRASQTVSRYIIRVHDPFNGMKLYQRLIPDFSPKVPPLRDACNDGRDAARRTETQIDRYRDGSRETRGPRPRPPPPRVVDRMGIFSGTRSSRGLTAYTHTLLWSSFKCAAGISEYLLQCRCIFLSRRGRRTSHQVF